jgi:hypothetical protein
VEADLAYIKAQLTKAPAPTTAAAVAAAPPAKAPAGTPAPPPPPLAIIPAKKFKFPSGSQIIGGIKGERPRVFLNAAGIASVKAKIGTDAVSAGLFKNVQKTGDVWLSKYELQQKRGEAAAGSGVGSEALHRFLSFGLLDHLSGDPKWKARMPSELEAVAKFTNWNPEEGEVCAEFVFGVALGYDWFRSTLNVEQARVVREAMIQLGVDALSAHLKHEPLPITTKRPEPGQKQEPAKAATPKKKEEEKGPKTSEDMVMASALMVAAIALKDEESAVANQAANLAAKVLGDGLTQFAPEGIWSEGLSRGEHVLDALAILSMTLRAATGSDYGMTLVEGLPQTQWARSLLSGPQGVFNYCSFEGSSLTKPWISTWLKLNHGSLAGTPFAVGPAASDQSGGLNQAGQLVFMSPYATGISTPATFDNVLATAQLATLRSAWHDNKAFYVGFKGGDNALPGSQLDLGTFILDAGGQRWATELGVFSAQGRPVNLTDTKRFDKYRDATEGQNVVRFVGAAAADDDKDKKKGAAPPTAKASNQAIDARAAISSFDSTPERGVAIVDLSDAYSNRVKDYQRGIMMQRGPQPYVVIQDEMTIKNNASPEWVMHTRAQVKADGKTAVLTLGGATLTATIVSPAGASFFAAEVPEPTNPQAEGSFKGITALKIPLTDVKGPVTYTVVMSLGDKTPEVPSVPLEKWVQKKR